MNLDEFERDFLALLTAHEVEQAVLVFKDGDCLRLRGAGSSRPADEAAVTVLARLVGSIVQDPATAATVNEAMARACGLNN